VNGTRCAPTLSREAQTSDEDGRDVVIVGPGEPARSGGFRRENRLFEAVEDEAGAEAAREEEAQGSVEVGVRSRLADHPDPLLRGRLDVARDLDRVVVRQVCNDG